jgi:chemotaxis protein methyltransferase CheR
MEQLLPTKQFNRLAHYVEEHYGIRMPPDKLVMIQARLSKRVRELEFSSFNEYIDFLFEDPNASDEISRMSDLVSTHMTSFFREPSHFKILELEILPELCKQHYFDKHNPLVVWSAASSTGEEIYSIAMVIDLFKRSHKKEYPHFDYAILGTDLSEQVLQTARQGIYSNATLESIPIKYHAPYIMRSKDQGTERFRFVPELRKHTFFHQLNLMEHPFKIQNSIQVVFCRNVLIYFNRERQERVVHNILKTLSPGGYLILGHSETLVNMDLPVKVVAPTVYKLCNGLRND